MPDIKVFSFRVEKYYKGEGPDNINIITDGSEYYPFIEQSIEYLLYIYDPKSEGASAYFDDVYAIVGAEQGIWKVRDGTAVNIGDGNTIQLSDLNK